MLYDLTIKIHGLLNVVYPKLDNGYFNDDEEKQLQKNFKILNKLNQENMDILFPERKNQQKNKP